MSVVNLQPGNVLHVNAAQINHNAHVYRTNQGSSSAGNVGWLPNGGVLQTVPLAIGGTTTFAINNVAGMIANGCPSMVQVLWDNAPSTVLPNVKSGEAQKILGSNDEKETEV